MGPQCVTCGCRGGIESGEDVFEPGAKVDVVGMAGGGETVQDGEVLSAAFAAGEKPVFTSEGNRADGVFGRVVVDIQLRIGENFRERNFQVQGVMDRFAERRRRHFFFLLSTTDFEEFFDQFGGSAADDFSFVEQRSFGVFVFGASFRVGLKLIELTNDFQGGVSGQIPGVEGIEKLSPDMRPAGGKTGIQRGVPGVGVADQRTGITGVNFVGGLPANVRSQNET